MKLLVIGPFPMPVHGCSLANEVFVNQLISLNLQVSTIDTNAVNVSSKKVGAFSFSKVFSFLKTYRDLKLVKSADVVYTTPGQTFFGIAKYIPFYRACIKNNIPYIIHVHGNHLGNEYKELTGLKKKIFGRYIKSAAAGIVLSESLRNNFDGLLPQDKVYAVENFAQNELTLSPPADKPKDMIKLLYLSNLMKEKGILDVLDALLLLKKSGIPFKADIAGKAEDEGKDEVTHRMKQLEGYVTYHNVVQGKAKKDLLNNSNVFILPTFYRMEGQPIALIEAMAAGNIVVTTKYSGIPDIVSVENGFFVKPQSPQDIFDTLKDISANLESYVNRISNHNIAYVKDNFTEEQFAKKLLNVVDKVYNNKNI